MIIENIFLQVDLVIKSIANSSAFNNYNYWCCFTRVIGRTEVSSRNTWE
jgi:hypothetical protein